MPDELKAKLRSIIDLDEGHTDKVLDKAIAQIDQAYKDVGYILDLPKITDASTYWLIKARAEGYMTGQEWYERFLDELLTIPEEDLTLTQMGVAYREAAKRAAGLE